MESDTFYGFGVHRRPAETVAIDGIIDGIETGKIGCRHAGSPKGSCARQAL